MTVPNDPSPLATEQVFRESGKLSDRIDWQGDALTFIGRRLDILGAGFAALSEKQEGDIKRLSSEMEWSNRSADIALKSHADIHALSEKHVDIAREQQQLKNDAQNNWHTRQADDRREYAQKENVAVEVHGLRAQIEKNDSRIRELELGLRAVLSEDSGAAGKQRSGQATVQQLAAVVGMIVAVVSIIIAVVLANAT